MALPNNPIEALDVHERHHTVGTAFCTEAARRPHDPCEDRLVDLSYSELLKLSAFFQGGVIAWVGFWVTLGQGASGETFSAFASFAAAYTLVILIEPVVDLAVLAAAKALRGRTLPSLVTPRLYSGV